MASVSVIIPNYNHAAYLEQRIESVLAQSFSDFEIILLDDASTDNSREILRRYKHNPRVRILIENEVNSGSTFRQWELGISQASGEYVWIAESDDVAEPDLLSTLSKVLTDHPRLAVAYCGSLRIDETARVHGRMEKPRFGSPWRGDFVASGSSIIRRFLLRGNVIPNASAVVFRRHLLFPGVLHEAAKYTLNGDWYVWTNLLMQGDIAYVTKPLNMCRFHPLKGSSRNIANFNNIAEVYRLRAFQYSKCNVSERARERLNHSLFHLWMAQRRAFCLPLESDETMKVLAEAELVDSRVRLRLQAEKDDAFWPRLKSHLAHVATVISPRGGRRPI